MKKLFYIVALVLVLSFSSLVLADDPVTDPGPTDSTIVEPMGPIEPPVPK